MSNLDLYYAIINANWEEEDPSAWNLAEWHREQTEREIEEITSRVIQELIAGKTPPGLIKSLVDRLFSLPIFLYIHEVEVDEGVMAFLAEFVEKDVPRQMEIRLEVLGSTLNEKTADDANRGEVIKHIKRLKKKIRKGEITLVHHSCTYYYFPSEAPSESTGLNETNANLPSNTPQSLNPKKEEDGLTTAGATTENLVGCAIYLNVHEEAVRELGQMKPRAAALTLRYTGKFEEKWRGDGGDGGDFAEFMRGFMKVGKDARNYYNGTRSTRRDESGKKIINIFGCVSPENVDCALCWFEKWGLESTWYDKWVDDDIKKLPPPKGGAKSKHWKKIIGDA